MATLSLASKQHFRRLGFVLDSHLAEAEVSIDGQAVGAAGHGMLREENSGAVSWNHLLHHHRHLWVKRKAVPPAIRHSHAGELGAPATSHRATQL